MNPPRRTLSAAVQPAVSAEVLAIIDQGAPKSQTEKPSVTVDAVKVQSTPSFRQPEEIQRQTKPKIEKGRGETQVSLTSVNFRLPANIPPGLFKASSDRKLKKLYPFTQQDIVSEALTDWLKKNGYPV